MKKFLVVMVTSILLQFTVKSQEYKVETITASAVPANILTSFNNTFSGSSVVQWEKHIFIGNQANVYNKYVCIFDQNDIRNRARYKEDGIGLTATTYFWLENVSKLPENVKNFAKTKYPDFELHSGEKERNLKTGNYVYRIRLKKGVSKLIVYVNESGEEINKSNIDIEIIATENENM